VPGPTPTPLAVNPVPSTPPAGFQLKPEPARGLPSTAFGATPRPQAATSQPQAAAVAKPQDDDWDLFFEEGKGAGGGKDTDTGRAGKKPVDLLADSFKEMQSKQNPWVPDAL